MEAGRIPLKPVEPALGVSFSRMTEPSIKLLGTHTQMRRHVPILARHENPFARSAHHVLIAGELAKFWSGQ